MKRIYPAGRYSRRIELCGYRDQLRSIGFDVQSRWLDGGHQISDTGTPIGDHGEALVESSSDGATALRGRLATDDFDDVCAADIVINFTEPPWSGAPWDGRHVEFGIALALSKTVIVVGYRENLFHWLDEVEFYKSWKSLLKELTRLAEVGL